MYNRTYSEGMIAMNAKLLHHGQVGQFQHTGTQEAAESGRLSPVHHRHSLLLQ